MEQSRSHQWNRERRRKSCVRPDEERPRSLSGRRTVSTLAATAAVVSLLGAAPASAEESTLDIYNNGYGSATFYRFGDKLDVCDDDADGAKVKATVQKWYESTRSWQAVGGETAPPANDPLGECYRKTIDVEPDSSVIRLHLWAEKNGRKIKASEEYSASGHA